MALYQVTSLLEKGGVSFSVQENRFTVDPLDSVLVVEKNQQIRILEDKGVVSVTQITVDFPGGIEYPQYVTINAQHLSDKFVYLDHPPVGSVEFVKMFFNNGTPQKYGDAFIVAGGKVMWNGLSLDGFLEEGDRILLLYPVIEV